MSNSTTNPYATPQTTTEIISDGPFAAGREVITKISLRSSGEKRCIVTGKQLPDNAKAESIQISKRSGRFNPFARLVAFNAYLEQTHKEKSRRLRIKMNILAVIPLALVYITCYSIGLNIIPSLLLAPYLVVIHFIKRRYFPQDRIFAKKEQNNYYRIHNLHPDFIASLPEHPDSTFL